MATLIIPYSKLHALNKIKKQGLVWLLPWIVLISAPQEYLLVAHKKILYKMGKKYK